MKTWQAILFTIALIIAANAVSVAVGFNLIWPLVLLTSLWAAIDSRKIQLTRYKSGISYGPVVLFVACFMLWIVGFPWYLSMRYKIKNGSATLKDVPPPIPAS